MKINKSWRINSGSYIIYSTYIGFERNSLLSRLNITVMDFNFEIILSCVCYLNMTANFNIFKCTL